MIQQTRKRLEAMLGRDELARLRDSSVAVIGSGLLGGALGYHLTLLEIGQVLIDCGRVEPENLGNQGFPQISVGDPKVEARAWQSAMLSPECPIEPVHAALEELGLARLAGVDLLISALDGRASRVRCNEISQRLGIRWIDAAVDGSGRRLLGSVTLYEPNLADAACYLCRRSPGDLAELWDEGRSRGCPSWRAQHVPLTPPTLAASAFGGVVAGFAATWGIQLLLGRAQGIGSHQLIIGGDPPRTQQVALRRAVRCPDGHVRLQPLRPSPGETLAALLDDAAAALGGEPESLHLHGRSLVLGLECPGCGARKGLVGVAQRFSDAEVRCEACGKQEMTPAWIGDRLTASEARGLADLRWSDLGLPEDDVVSVAAGERVAHYRVHPRAGSRGKQGGKEAR